MKTTPIDKANKTSLKLSEYRSSGRELHVFRAESPGGLLGAHAELMETFLNSQEQIKYLLYAPIREAGSAPFGMHAEAASHAVAVTNDRFLISQDRHIKNIPPTVQDIPFENVISVEIGNALLLGWLAIRFIENGQPSCTSLFYSARGSHHFERAVCAFREVYRESRRDTPTGRLTWADVWEKTPKTQSDVIHSLILKEENPLYLLRSTETWGMKDRERKKICLATDGVLLVTDHGLIHALDEQPIAPHILSYGVNVCCISLDALYALEHIENKEHGVCQTILRLQAGMPPASVFYEVPFDKNTDNSIEDLVHTIQKMKKMGRE